MKKISLVISPYSEKLLSYGLPVLAFYFIYIFYAVATVSHLDASLLVQKFSPQLQHIIMALTILIAGSALLDISEKEIKKRG